MPNMGCCGGEGLAQDDLKRNGHSRLQPAIGSFHENNRGLPMAKIRIAGLLYAARISMDETSYCCWTGTLDSST